MTILNCDASRAVNIIKIIPGNLTTSLRLFKVLKFKQKRSWVNQDCWNSIEGILIYRKVSLTQHGKEIRNHFNDSCEFLVQPRGEKYVFDFFHCNEQSQGKSASQSKCNFPISVVSDYRLGLLFSLSPLRMQCNVLLCTNK